MSISEFENLVVNNAEYLRPYAKVFTKREEMAEDLLQDTICKALLNKQHYKVNTNMQAWLYTIMRNLFINRYRRNKKQKYLFGENIKKSFEYCPETFECSPADSLIQMKELKVLIERLPNLFKTAFLLCVEGFKYTEIAKMTDEPVGTIKSRIYFARKLLKASISRF